MSYTTIAKVVDGEHAQDELVIVEGHANRPELREGDEAWSFLLVSSVTAVRVTLPGDIATYEAALACTRNGIIEGSPYVEVTGQVRLGRGEVPALVATGIFRLEEPS